MKEDFTEYDVKPPEFVNYLKYYGSHFNKKLCDFAIKLFDKQPYNKEKLDTLFKAYNIELKNAKLHDAVFIANWAGNIFLGSSLKDERSLALFIKDMFEKESDLIFNRWYADISKLGIPVEWEEMI